ncbi:DUF4012 domain-containing protein [bacterium]|nr:DUF4012 domain-containing protein [bacterium]
MSPLKGLLISRNTDDKTTTFIRAILGDKVKPKTTLLLFANNNALRVGGGFVGTIGVLRGDGDNIAIREIRSVYYYDHRLDDKVGFVVAPNYMGRFTDSLRIADSLSEPITSLNLQRAHDVYSRVSGEKIDNVVEITPDLLKSILDITGPIELREYNLTVDSTNVLKTIQLEVESGKDRVIGKDPKSVLSVLANEIIQRIPQLSLRDTGRYYSLLGRVSAGEQARALLNISDPSRLVVTNSREEYIGAKNALLITSSNLDAGKASMSIKQNISLDYYIGSDGKDRYSLDITRTHTASEKLSYVDPRTGGGNDIIGTDISAIQVYLPLGARPVDDNEAPIVLESTNRWVKYTEEMQLGLQETKNISFTYTLQRREEISGRISGSQWVLYQFGASPQRVKVRIHAPAGYVVADLPSNATTVDNRIIQFDIFQEQQDLELKYDFRSEAE